MNMSSLTIAICIVSAAAESMTISGAGSRVDNDERRMVKSVRRLSGFLNALAHSFLTDQHRVTSNSFIPKSPHLIFIRAKRGMSLFLL